MSLFQVLAILLFLFFNEIFICILDSNIVYGDWIVV